MRYIFVLLTVSLTLSLTLGLTACQTTSETSSPLSDDVLREMVQTRYIEPFKSGDVTAWVAAFHPDAVAMHNHRPADKGKAAIHAFGEAVHSFLILDQYDVKVTEIRQGPGWAYTTGEYQSSFLLRETGEPAWPPETGKFVLLWEQQGDGEWLIVLDMGNSSGPRA